MKKRLLITSIVMMLVVAVALSTATYAWFTQNATVQANSVTMTAATANAQSISIAWFGTETRKTFLDSGAASDPLQPMCPTTDISNNTTYASTIAFNTAFVDTANAFIGSTVTSATPYTWNNGSGTSSFYINNDSNSVDVPVYVTVDSIIDKGVADNDHSLDPLAGTTLLEGSGKVYYKKIGDGEYIKMTASDYTANVDTVSAAITKIVTAYNTANDPDITADDVKIYSTKGIADYIRVAIFATGAVDMTNDTDNISTTFDASKYTYKGLLSKNPASNDTVWGVITNNGSLSNISSTNQVTVINSLPRLQRVYVVVKVWIDGAAFTQHENALRAGVSLTFSTTNANS